MLLAELLAASERVAGTRSRLAKIDALAECLRRLDAPEIALGVAYLSGDTRQGRIGIGYATLKDALAAAPASAPRLTLAQIDEALARLAQIEGKGPAAENDFRLGEQAIAFLAGSAARGPPRQVACCGVGRPGLAVFAVEPPAGVVTATICRALESGQP